jgi:hypothetical protein
MGNEGNVGAGTGGVSILAIFVVLCLTALAALSLVSAQADSSLAEKASVSTEQYYQADASAEEKLAEIIGITQGGGDWQAVLAGMGYAVEQADGAVVVGFDERINDAKELKVKIEIGIGSDGEPTGGWKRLRWQTQALPLAEEPQTLPLLEP